MEGARPYRVEIDLERPQNLLVLSYGLEQEELFPKLVLVHHKVEGVVRFPLILIDGYVCLSFRIDGSQRTVEMRDSFELEVEADHFLSHSSLTMLHFLILTSEIST